MRLRRRGRPRGGIRRGIMVQEGSIVVRFKLEDEIKVTCLALVCRAFNL